MERVGWLRVGMVVRESEQLFPENEHLRPTHTYMHNT